MKSLKQHEFKAEWVDDEHGPAVMLTQSDGYCEPQTVLVHPWQFRSVCEQFGIVPTGNAEARRSIARTTRRLVALSERIQSLQEYVANHSDHEHADLSAELAMLNALADLAGEWAVDAQELADASETPGEPQEGPKQARGGAEEARQDPGIGRPASAAQPALL